MNSTTPKLAIIIGLFFTSLATLLFELLLTRIFSVTMLYHFAFMVISVALFGLTAGALLVFLLPKFFKEESTGQFLTLGAILFALTIGLSIIIHLEIPNTSWVSLLVVNYVLMAIPFAFSGVVITLVLTRFVKKVGLLYAADLGGAALGCILLVVFLDIMDGITAVFGIAFLAGIAGFFFSLEFKSRNLKVISAVASLSLGILTLSNAILFAQGSPLFHIKWIRGRVQEPALIERWNSYSRVQVWGDPINPEKPSGWGLSDTLPSDYEVRQLTLNIDDFASTSLTSFQGDIKSVDFLKYDVTNIGHYLKSGGDALVIGSGGGRDVLSALAFGQRSVVGVEINRNVIEIVNGEFGDFTGHLDSFSNVSFVNDEARSYITRLDKKYDFIQMSLIDSWAATTAGAFALTENSLYTVEAWNIFLDHLKPGGIYSVSRWYFRDQPGEMYRLVSLATASLEGLGVEDPQDHMMIVRYNPEVIEPGNPDGVGTLLLSNVPFSEEDISRIEEISDQMKFEVVMTPKGATDPTYQRIAAQVNSQSFLENFPIDISPTFDDRPYFFHMLRFRDIFRREGWNQGLNSFNTIAVYGLGILFITVVGLILVCILFPLIVTRRDVDLDGTTPLFIYFIGIGFGFMLFEVSQLQRLIIFLGHPTYSLTVLLFTLLVSSSLGSYLTNQIQVDGELVILRRLFFLLIVLLLYGLLSPMIIDIFQASQTSLRIMVAAGLIFPVGLFLGMAFPMGMKIASNHSDRITPWLWALNGAASVVAAVITVIISMSAGISTAFWVGFACYVAVLMSLLWFHWNKRIFNFKPAVG